jgi:beta-lactamase regulating signal transducer with metallopeptidase domain
MNSTGMFHWLELSTWLRVVEGLFGRRANAVDPLMHWLASSTWMHIVEALLHTLWVGALVTAAVFIVLRRTANPVVRYWCSMLGLAGILMAGVIGWAVLDAQATQSPILRAHIEAARPGLQRSAPAGRLAAARDSEPLARRASFQARGGSANPWFSWLALAWVIGAAVMLGRAGFGVIEAEKLHRTTRLLEDPHLLEFIGETRRKLGIRQRLQAVVTEKLRSPAVVGIFVPTLILPLSLLTSMPLEQLQLLVLHELAHIRRGDYVANLVQLFIEALLFFNPAVWWLSRQARIEREACCDAIAIGVAGDRAGYARALVEVAERNLGSVPVTAAAFAAGRRRTRLADRVQRLLAPGYRPSLRLTWKALAGSLILGFGILIASAIAAQWTVGAAVKLLTPQQRIARIEAKMKSLGQPPAAEGEASPGKVEVSGRIQTADGAPLPKSVAAEFVSFWPRGSGVYGVSADGNGECRARVARGDLFFDALANGFAPAVIGPIDTSATNRVEGLELVLERGFPISLKVMDADSGRPVAGASLACLFWIPGRGCSFGVPGNDAPWNLRTDHRGNASLEHCGSVPLVVTMTKPGYETAQRRLEHPVPGDTLTIYTRRALPVAGSVIDRASGAPLEGASVYVLGADGAPGVRTSDPKRPGAPLAVSDKKGRFEINELPRGGWYWLLVRATGRADAILPWVSPGTTNLHAALGPELVVRGEIAGDLKRLFKGAAETGIYFFYSYQTGSNSRFGEYGLAPVQIKSGIAHFSFVLPRAGSVRIDVGHRSFTRTVTAPVRDWHIESPEGGSEERRRKIIVRFEASSGVPPGGTISADVPGSQPGTGVQKELEIKNGQVSLEAPVGWVFSFKPARTIGYWFAGQIAVRVTHGAGPQVISVPVVPAGAIYAQARNEDGSLASNVGFQVRELKRSPLVKGSAFTTLLSDSWSSDQGPRKYVATPLPLEGTYVVIASQDNHFAVSQPIKLTEEAPDRSVELRFAKGAPIVGQVVSPNGKPFFGAEVHGEWRYKDSSFGLASMVTGEKGRFTLEDCTPGIGEYSVVVRYPGMETLDRPARPNAAPMVLKLRPGLRLAGRVVDAASQRPIVRAQVSAVSDSGGQPTETTRTDDRGNFEFDTLRDIPYRLFVDGCYSPHGPMVARPGATKPLVLKVNTDRGPTIQLGGTNADSYTKGKSI